MQQLVEALIALTEATLLLIEGVNILFMIVGGLGFGLAVALVVALAMLRETLREFRVILTTPQHRKPTQSRGKQTRKNRLQLLRTYIEKQHKLSVLFSSLF